MDHLYPERLPAFIERLDDFIATTLRPLEFKDDNQRFFDHRREFARTDQAPTVSISSTVEDSSVIVTISDNAGGMPESVRARIFESQFTTKTAGKGTGLGLSIAHQIVTLNHQGQISCVSEQGVGTTFRIALPIA